MFHNSANYYWICKCFEYFYHRVCLQLLPWNKICIRSLKSIEKVFGNLAFVQNSSALSCAAIYTFWKEIKEIHIKMHNRWAKLYRLIHNRDPFEPYQFTTTTSLNSFIFHWMHWCIDVFVDIRNFIDLQYFEFAIIYNIGFTITWYLCKKCFITNKKVG